MLRFHDDAVRLNSRIRVIIGTVLHIGHPLRRAGPETAQADSASDSRAAAVLFPFPFLFFSSLFLRFSDISPFFKFCLRL